MNRMDYTTSTQEEQRFEESVCKQVEHSRRNRNANPQRHHHVTELTDGRVSENPLNIVLRNPD
ncbi:hypothetical protein D3C86_1709910 [compost metagenome]